jgi:ABC-2 type transport system permease protein
MKKYFMTYRRLLLLNFEALVVYRANFINNIIASTAWALFGFLAIFFLTAKTPVVFGWKREELMLLTAVHSIVIGIFYALFSRGFQQLPSLIEKGELDGLLIKPIDTQFLSTVKMFHYSALIRTLMGIGFIIYFSNVVHYSFSWIYFLSFLSILFFSVITMFSIWSIFLTSLIWNPTLTNLVDILSSILGMAKYPYEMYRRIGEVFACMLIPLIFATVVPVKILYRTFSWQEIVIFLISTCVLFSAARIYWLFALRSYTSASN